MLAWPLMVVGTLSTLASAEPGGSLCHVSYLYPAGAQQGTEIELTAGGQGLRKVNEVYISGKGVDAEVMLTVTGYKRNYGDLIRHQQKKIREKAFEAKRKKNGDKKNPKKKPKTQDVLDKEKNEQKLNALKEINTDASAVKILVIPTNEELEIAKQAFDVLRHKKLK